MSTPSIRFLLVPLAAALSLAACSDPTGPAHASAAARFGPFLASAHAPEGPARVELTLINTGTGFERLTLGACGMHLLGYRDGEWIDFTRTCNSINVVDRDVAPGESVVLSLGWSSTLVAGATELVIALDPSGFEGGYVRVAGS